MRIDPSNPYLNNAASDGPAKASGDTFVSSPAGAKQAVETAGAADSGDTLQLSGTLAQVQQLKSQLAQLPDLRAARVAALQQQIQQGSYRPSGEQIAGAMIAEFSGTSGH
jgi:flagellar biosynthesis anti-sigma factor FlgM